MPSPCRIGVILAAGRGRRMGRTKQLVPWPTPEGPKPLVAAAYDAIYGNCDRMIVVLGHEADAVSGALGDRPFHRAQSDPDAPMFASILAGIRAAQSIDPHATIVLQPGDHPEIGAATLVALMGLSLQRPLHAIVPEHQGRGGHPVLIPASVARRILESDCPTGLGDFWKAHPELRIRVPLGDPGICRDIDTPADLSAG
jgi:molybdenum cofactor cytidylyltransferase